MTKAQSYQFGRYRLDGAGRLLLREGKMVPLPPKAIETLLVLVQNAGNVVSKPELMKAVWADTFVEEGSLTRTISLLREALADQKRGQDYIVTISKRGYRFAAPVEQINQSTPVAPSTRPMLVVLPFENLSRDRRREYFSDGLTEEMITQLGSLDPDRLGVIARTSAMQYKSTRKSIQQIGRELNVSFVLEGSVRRAGNRVRIAAQLIRVSDQTHLWAESYERDLDDILALQSLVARTIAAQISLKLAPGERPVLAPPNQVDPEAYDAYLRGRYLWNRRTRETLLKSLKCFAEALKRSPRYAAAYAGMADSYLTLQDFGFMPTREAIAKARAAAGKALAIDEALSEAHNSLAHAHFHEFQWGEAEREFKRAIELNPSYAVAHFYYANYLLAFGRIDEAYAEARAAQLSDPMSLPMQAVVADVFYYGRQHEQAIAQARRILQIDPTFAHAHEDLGRCFEQLGRHEQAIAALRNAVQLSRRSPSHVASLAFAYACAGRTKETLKLLHELKRRRTRGHMPAYFVALVYVGLGQKDQAFAWLERAYQDRSSILPFIAANPRLASLHDDPRFPRLLRLVGVTSGQRLAHSELAAKPEQQREI